MPNSSFPGVHPNAESKSLTCGSCQWFASGYEGQNCQKSREVELATPACIEYTATLKDFFHEIASKDKYLHGLREVLRTKEFIVSDSYMEELKGYIVELDANRSFRMGNHQDMEFIANSLLNKVVAYRSRVSTIFTDMMDKNAEVDKIIAKASLWLYSKYVAMRELKNEGMRKSAFDRLMPELVPLQSKLGKIITTAKYLDERLDANERTLRSIMETSSRLVFNRERVV